ncbi:hypothetical protein FACS189490_13450 [Clostridia bacterium]|nr:hypothetical protein FACS189490_13450 [Clostridia bacterium]
MRKYKLYLLMLILALPACSSQISLPTRPPEETVSVASEKESEQIFPTATVDATGDENEKTTPMPVSEPRVLTVAYSVSQDYMNPIKFASSKFKGVKGYENVTIKEINYFDKEDPLTTKLHNRIALELMSGTGADIIQTNNLVISKIADKGFFEDLNLYIDNETGIDRADFFENILNAVEVDEKLFQTPFGIGFTVIQVNSNYSDAVREIMGDSLTMKYKDMIRCYDEINAKTPFPEDFYINVDWGNRFNVARSFDYEYTRFFNPVKNIVNFGDGFISLLNEIEPYVTNMNKVNYGDFELPVPVGAEVAAYVQAPTNVLFCPTTSANRINMWHIEYGEGTYPYDDFYLASSSEGTITSYNGALTFAINSNSKQKALAWGFLKYLCTDELTVSNITYFERKYKGVLHNLVAPLRSFA